jgi:hypothetical protein
MLLAIGHQEGVREGVLLLALPDKVVEHLLRWGDIAQFRVRVVISRGVGSSGLRANVL